MQKNKKIYTTRRSKDPIVIRGKLLVRKEQEKLRLTQSEILDHKARVPYLEDKDKSTWLLKAPEYVVDGLKPILLTYKVSENTMKQLPLFSCVLGKETLHDTRVSSDMSALFNREADINLREIAFEKATICPIFIKLFDAYPEEYETLKASNGKIVTLTFDGEKLTVEIEEGDTFIMDVQTIKHEV